MPSEVPGLKEAVDSLRERFRKDTFWLYNVEADHKRAQIVLKVTNGSASRVGINEWRGFPLNIKEVDPAYLNALN